MQPVKNVYVMVTTLENDVITYVNLTVRMVCVRGLNMDLLVSVNLVILDQAVSILSNLVNRDRVNMAFV